MPDEPESLILQLLRDMRAETGDMRAEMADMRGEMATRDELSATKEDLRGEMQSLRADVAADFVATRKEFNEKIVGLRRAVVEYHTTVIGHGAIISELEARLRRVEQHLNLEAPEAH